MRHNARQSDNNINFYCSKKSIVILSFQFKDFVNGTSNNHWKFKTLLLMIIIIIFVVFVGVSVLVMHQAIVMLRGLEGNLANVFVTAIHQPTLREKTYVDPLSIIIILISV